MNVFQTPYTCVACQKFVIAIESSEFLYGMDQLPNTYDVQSDEFNWKFHQFVGYVLIPHMFKKTTALVDLYLCIDESDSETIDVLAYARKFLQETILPAWKHLKLVDVSLPALSCPRHVECRKQNILDKGISS